MQKRTSTKDVYPGYYDVATGGIVLASESYEQSAERELAEELAIQDVALTALFDFYHADGGNRVWGRAFSCVYDGPVVLQEEEVESGAFYKIDAVLVMSREYSFTPDGLEVLHRYITNRCT